VLRCAVCSAEISPEDDAPVQAVLIDDTRRGITILNYSHPGCMTSRVIERDVGPVPTDWLTHWMPMWRPRDAVQSVLVWESVMTLRAVTNEESHDLMEQRLRRLGFKGATDRLDELIAPVLSRWQLELVDRDRLELVDPDGNRDEFDNVQAVLPDGWLTAASTAGRVLVVYGSGFGIERYDLDRVDGVLQAGEAICGLIPFISTVASVEGS